MDSHLQIRHLLFRYASAIDTGDFSTLGTLFKYATIRSSEGNIVASGPAEVEAMYRSIIKIYPDTGTPKTQHLVSNIIVMPEANDSHASIAANFTVMQQLPNGKIECIISGEYTSKFQKIENQWYFEEHRMQQRFSGDLSHHLLIDVADINKATTNK